MSTPVPVTPADAVLRSVAAEARAWLSSQILSHEASVARLVGIRNDAVNQTAQAEVLARMRGELEVWRYLYNLLPAEEA
jgi:hypothetical protein